jgi:hypothetical protein
MKTPDARRPAKTTNLAKSDRRARRAAKAVRRGDRLAAMPFGPVDPTFLRLLQGVSRFDPGGAWADIAPTILPLVKRVRHSFPTELAPIHLHVPPGVWVGFGVDLGPAWAHVSRDLLSRWGIDEATLLGTALENLRARILVEPPLIEPAMFAGVPATVVQAQGWGSAMILAPDRLAPVIGPAPRTILTPVRNALVALPDDVDAELAVAIWDAFSEDAADELDIDPLHWTGSAITRFDEPTGALPN